MISFYKYNQVQTQKGKKIEILQCSIAGNNKNILFTLRSSKWSQEEVDMLKTSVTRFNEDLNQLSSHIKNKQTSQIRQTIKNKSYASAGLVQKTEVKSPPPIIIQQQQQPSTQITQQAPIVIQEQVIFHQPSSIGSTIKIEHQLPTELVTTTSQPQTSSHITLNRLNAQEEEMDDETSFENEVKMEAGFSEVS